MPREQRYDRVLLGATVLLTAIGLSLLAAASWVIAVERYNLPGTYFFHWQLAAALIGLTALLAAMHLRLELISDVRLTRWLLAASWAALVLALLQSPVKGTHRWVQAFGVSVQPSVVTRLALILVCAALLAAAAEQRWPRVAVIRIGCIVAVTVGLVLAQPDLGTAALLAAVITAMVFVAGLPLWRLLPPALLAAATLGLATVTSEYRWQRVIDFVTGGGWQTRQSLIALGSGGWLGTGYGHSVQKLRFLPEPHTDFIFAITGEELGFIGVLTLLALTAVIAWRGLCIARAQPTAVRSLIAFGLTMAFTLQVLIHVGVCLRMLPPKGMPLPLVSYGKTEMVVTLASIGLLLNLSREVST
jgi:cell division protein FtsW